MESSRSDQDDFDELCGALFAEHAPETPTEKILVEQMAQHVWLSRRAQILNRARERAEARAAALQNRERRREERHTLDMSLEEAKLHHQYLLNTCLESPQKDAHATASGGVQAA